MVKIAFLADHPEVIPTLAQWFRAQWPDYYARRTLADIEQDFHPEANLDRLPLRLVAFESGALVGTIALRERALETQPELRPGLGGLYVVGPHRGCGVGTELVRAGMEAARRLEYERVYTGTAVAGGILEGLGWERIKLVLNHGEQLAIYRCDLNDIGPTCVACDATRG